MHLTQASARARAGAPVPEGDHRAARRLHLFRRRSPRRPTPRLAPARETIRRVVLLGPAHRVAGARPRAAVGARLRDAARARSRSTAGPPTLALTLPQVAESDAAHALEHSLEVQLPFLQAVLGEFRDRAVRRRRRDADEVAEVIERLWGGPETLIVVSSDLSHYHRYAEAQRIDRATGRRDPRAVAPTLDHEQACGATPINGLLRVRAPARPATPQLLDLRNSGDTAGDQSRVVGYASFAFAER